jgi:rod shape determining protein RodA
MTQSNWRHFDFWLLGAVALMTIFGITMIRSAVAGNIELEASNIVQRQIIFAVLGFIVIFIVAAIDYHLWASISRPMYIITAIFLGALTIAGQALYGSARWFDTGVILIQP